MTLSDSKSSCAVARQQLEVKTQLAEKGRK